MSAGPSVGRQAPRLLKWSMLLVALAAGLMAMLALIFGGALLLESLI